MRIAALNCNLFRPSERLTVVPLTRLPFSYFLCAAVLRLRRDYNGEHSKAHS
jgi:hypothetical protein